MTKMIRYTKNTRRPNAVMEGIVPPAPHPLNPERMDGESYEDYKYRRAATNYILKLRRQGKYWNGNRVNNEEGD
jgi:hypothetical protein